MVLKFHNSTGEENKFSLLFPKTSLSFKLIYKKKLFKLTSKKDSSIRAPNKGLLAPEL